MNKTTEAFEAWWADTGEQSLFALGTTMDDDIKTLAGIAWEAAIREALADHSGDANEMVYSKPSVFDGVCCGCSKKAADGYALYCVECWEKSNGDPFANAGKPITEQDHIADADKMVAEPVQEPWKCACGANLYIDSNGAPASKAEPVKQELNWGANKFMPHEQPVQQEPVELQEVKRVVEEGGGFWRECSGCYESNEGAPPKGAVFSKAFGCYLGCGCDECGGLGAIWDNTDYEDMARFMAAQDAAPVQPVKQEPVAYWDEKSGEVCRAGWLKFHARENDKDRFTTPLYAEPVDAKAIRAEALEEAKKACDEICKKAIDSGYTVKGETFIDGFGDGACACAAAIRGLK